MTAPDHTAAIVVLSIAGAFAAAQIVVSVRRVWVMIKEKRDQGNE